MQRVRLLLLPATTFTRATTISGKDLPCKHLSTTYQHNTFTFTRKQNIIVCVIRLN